MAQAIAHDVPLQQILPRLKMNEVLRSFSSLQQQKHDLGIVTSLLAKYIGISSDQIANAEQLTLFRLRSHSSSHDEPSSFLASAYAVLDLVGHPMSADEIVSRAVHYGLLKTQGQTPNRTMAARLSEDIARAAKKSIFMRTMPGHYGLRVWGHRIQEYEAVDHLSVLSHYYEDVLVVPFASIDNAIVDAGLYSGPLDWKGLERDVEVMRRENAESDTDVVQLVSFFIVESKSKFFTYMRGSRLPESRLRGEFSIGLGGHLGPEDRTPLFNFLDPVHGKSLMLRELFEELAISQREIDNISFQGVIYDTSRPVSKQHLALVYSVTVRTEKVKIAEPGYLHRGKFESLDEISQHEDDFENWSRIIISELKRSYDNDNA